jgi:threonine dehydratase
LLLSALIVAPFGEILRAGPVLAQIGPALPPLVQPPERTNAGFLTRARALRDQAVKEGDQAYGAVVVCDVVEPAHAPCIFETARSGRLVKIQNGEQTIMAMLECYQPSLVAWRVLSRVADAFMTVSDEEAIAAMRRLARPTGVIPQSSEVRAEGAGLAGLIKIAQNDEWRRQIALGPAARALLVNTDGAMDARCYQ